MSLPYDEAMSQGRIGLPVRNPEVPGSALKRSDEEWEQATRSLLNRISEGILMRIFEEVRKGPDWLITHHFGICMEVRNLLHAGVITLPPEDAIFKKMLNISIYIMKIGSCITVNPFRYSYYTPQYIHCII